MTLGAKRISLLRVKVSGLSYQNELEMKCPVLHGPTDCDGASTYTDILALFENGRREVRIECLKSTGGQVPSSGPWEGCTEQDVWGLENEWG